MVCVCERCRKELYKHKKICSKTYSKCDICGWEGNCVYVKDDKLNNNRKEEMNK